MINEAISLASLSTYQPSNKIVGLEGDSVLLVIQTKFETAKKIFRSKEELRKYLIPIEGSFGIADVQFAPDVSKEFKRDMVKYIDMLRFKDASSRSKFEAIAYECVSKKSDDESLSMLYENYVRCRSSKGRRK